MITKYEPKDVIPYHPSVIDIETAPDGSLLDIGYVYVNAAGDNEYITCSDWSSFTEYVLTHLRSAKGDKETKYRYSHIYAHNGSGFDWLSYCSYLMDNIKNVELNVMMSEMMIIGIIVTFPGKQKLYLCDSLRLLPYALKDVASKLNVDHQKIYVGDYITKMDQFKRDDPAKYYEYLQEDCYALQEAIYRFWCRIYELEGSIGKLPFTLPALALKIWRKSLEYDITTPWNEKVRDFTRRAYTGGRTECYKTGYFENMNVFDVNSMYPAMMSRERVPVSHRAMKTYEYEEGSCGFYEIEYEQTNRTIPPILRDEVSKEFQYSGKGVYYSAEIDLLVRCGGNFRLSYGYIFQATGYIFRSFVERYYNLRVQAEERGDEATKFIVKILLNSLYGKFGQRDTKKHLETRDNKKALELVEKNSKVTMYDEFMLIEDNERAEHEFVAIAAIITSTARVELFKYIEMYPNDYIYADTDSIHLANDKELPVSSGLGGLKLETTGEGVYLGKKLYYIAGKVKAKGVGKAARDGQLTKKEMLRLLDSGEVLSVDFDSFSTLRGVLLRNETPCKPVRRTRTIRRTKL